MTLEEIKKMSDEDFLKLVKTIIENSEAKDKNVTYLSPKMYKLYSWLDDNLIYGVGPITGGLFALISQALLLQYGVNEKKSAIIVGITWLSTTAFLSLFLYFDNKRKTRR